MERRSLDLAVIEDQGRRIIQIGRSAPDRVVPQYPTWTLSHLVGHVAAIHGRTAEICRRLPRERIPAPQRPAGVDVFDWAGEQLDSMLAGLDTADHAVVVWTFGSDTRLGFWSRRMVIETGLHRWDAQGAVEDPRPLHPLVAAHGLDEFPDMYLPRLGAVPTIDLTATDQGRSWRMGDGEPVATIEGTASDLFLRLMSRPGVSLPPTWERALDALDSPADR